MSALPPNYTFAQPTDWYDQLPKLADFNFDVGKWQQAVKDYAATANGGPAFPAMPSDQQMSDAYGPGWSAAGSAMAPVSLGEYQAGLLNREYLGSQQPGVKGPSFEMQLASRQHVRPDEVQAAYNAVNPDTGEPLLLPQLGAYAEDIFGLTPSGHYQGQGPANLLPSQTDPNYVRDEAARRQAIIDQHSAAAGGSTGAGAGPGGAAPGSLPGGGFIMPGGDPSAAAPSGPGGAGAAGGGGLAPDWGYLWPTSSPSVDASAPAAGTAPDTTWSDPTDPTGATDTTTPTPVQGAPGHAHWESFTLPPAQQAAQLHQQYGSTATMDPRYPDWMLKHQPNQPQGPQGPARRRMGF